MKRKYTFYMFMILFFPFIVNAEKLEYNFVGFGGSGDDRFKSIISTDDGFVAVGSSSSTDIVGIDNKGDYDAIIAKFDKDGTLKWVNNLGGPDYDEFHDVIEANDGGYIVVGYYGPAADTLPDSFIAKYDEDGKLVWKSTHCGNKLDDFSDVISLNDDSYIVLALSNSTNLPDLPNLGSYDVILNKYDNDGNLIWMKSYGGSDAEGANDILKISDNEFAVLVSTYSLDIPNLETENSSDILVNFDENGNVLRQKVIGTNPKHSFEYMKIDSDGNYYFAGMTFSSKIDNQDNFGVIDGVLSKYDENLNLVWERNYGGEKIDRYGEFELTSDNGILISLDTNSSQVGNYTNLSNYDSILVKYDSSGNIEWTEKFTGNANDHLSKVVAYDNGYLLYGYSDSTDIIDYSNKGNNDAIFVLSSSVYEIVKKEAVFGKFDVIQDGDKFKIVINPDIGYDLDQIIIKDRNGEIIDYTFSNGNYYFDLKDDVTVEVIYKEIVNPNTSIVDYSIFILILVSAMLIIMNKIRKKKYL